MKRLITALAALALIATGCNKNDIEQPEPQKGNLITFGSPSVTVTTKGADNLLDQVGASISIWGYHTKGRWKDEMVTATPNLFYRQMAENTEGTPGTDKYTYTPPQYWYTTGYHHFFAFSPYGIAVAGGARQHISQKNDPGQPWITYMVKPAATDHVDVLWAWAQQDGKSLLNIPGTPNANNQKLNFDFKHALTKVTFAARQSGALDADRYMITAIIIQNVLYEAITQFKYDNTIDAYTGATWVLDDTQKDQQDILIAAGTGLETHLLTTTTTQITASNGYMFMMPQQIEQNSESADNPTIYIVVTDNNLTSDPADDINRNLIMPMTSPDIYSTPHIKNVSGTPGQDGKGDGWWAGQSVLYTIVYHGGGDLPLGITATVSDWGDQPVPVILPATYLNVTANTINFPPTGGSIVQNYWTDYKVTGNPTPVTITANATTGTINVSKAAGAVPTDSYTITAGAGASGTVTIKAGILSKVITVTSSTTLSVSTNNVTLTDANQDFDVSYASNAASVSVVSNNTAVATVTAAADGHFTIKAGTSAGTTTVTATAGSKSETINVTVRPYLNIATMSVTLPETLIGSFNIACSFNATPTITTTGLITSAVYNGATHNIDIAATGVGSVTLTNTDGTVTVEKTINVLVPSYLNLKHNTVPISGTVSITRNTTYVVEFVTNQGSIALPTSNNTNGISVSVGSLTQTTTDGITTGQFTLSASNGGNDLNVDILITVTPIVGISKTITVRKI